MAAREIFTSSPELDEAIVDSSRWADEVWLHEQFSWLRANSPLRKMSPDGFDPFWSVAKYDDIVSIEGNKELFINDPRPILGPKLLQATIEQLVGRRHLVRSLVTMDAPDHLKYRAVAQRWFMRTNLRKLQSQIDDLAVLFVDRMQEFDGQCDFVKDIAIWYPLRVIMTILGVPEEDQPLMLKLTQELFGSSDPEVRRSFGPESLMSVVADFDNYFEDLTRKRREHPTDDVASVIANAQIDGEPMPQFETNSYYTIIATAGHDTTSSSTSGGLLALIENPDQMEKLRDGVEEFMPTAINEMIRWVTPVRQFMRTATADCVVRDAEIKEGDSCVLWYPSANRDEEIFDDPFSFRVDRENPKHLAFGFGVHVCLGQHLARMEMEAFFREFLRRVKHVELNGEPRFTEAGFVGGLKSLPIKYELN